MPLFGMGQTPPHIMHKYPICKDVNDAPEKDNESDVAGSVPSTSQNPTSTTTVPVVAGAGSRRSTRKRKGREELDPQLPRTMQIVPMSFDAKWRAAKQNSIILLVSSKEVFRKIGSARLVFQLRPDVLASAVGAEMSGVNANRIPAEAAKRRFEVYVPLLAWSDPRRTVIYLEEAMGGREQKWSMACFGSAARKSGPKL
ncbi:hypothetical protein C8R44DRAFT_732741 [Mycena epipterygia]|nr:hypothetical protein C8R44DRAFT_732741 [Mycena epipterygia]